MIPAIKRTTTVYHRCCSSILHKLTKQPFGTVTKCDVIVIGAGIAGSSCSYRLAQIHNLNVICLEKESNPGCHATGKSFGIFAESNARCTQSKLLTLASRPFFESPDEECVDDSDDTFDQSILHPTGLLAIASPDEYSYLFDEFAPNTYSNRIEVLPISEALDLVPYLKRRELSDYAIYDSTACNFDTQLVYDHFLVGSYNVGVQYYFDQNTVEINKNSNGNWEVQCFNAATKRIDRFEAGLLLNCGGAWADEVALTAGIKPLGLRSQQRNVIVFTYKGDNDNETENDKDKQQTPWIGWISPATGEAFHCCFQNNNGVFLYDNWEENHSNERGMTEMISETISQYTILKAQKVARKSVGTKCSTRYDKNIVIGPPSEDKSFSWCAALGSYGLQLAPAYSEITSYLALNKEIPPQYIDIGIDINQLLPSRLT